MILIGADRINYCALRRDQQGVLVRQGKEVRALPHLTGADRIFSRQEFIPSASAQEVKIIPMDQISGAIKQDHAALAFNARPDRQKPLVLFSPYARVAEAGGLHSLWRSGDNGVSGEFLPGSHSIFAPRQALDLRGNTRIKNRRGAPFNHCAAGPTTVLVWPARGGCKRDRKVLPVHQIGTHSVPPMHALRKCPVGVVLIKHVVLTLPDDGPVGIVHPVCRGHQVISRPLRVRG